MIITRSKVRAAVDQALAANPQAELLDAVDIAAEQLAIPREAVLDALAEETPAC